MSGTKEFNIGGKTFGNPIGREAKPVAPVSNEQVELNAAQIELNENEIIRLDNQKANLVDVAKVTIDLSNQNFVAIPTENNVYELVLTEDTTGFKDGVETQLKMTLGTHTVRFNDSFNDASGESKIIVIDDRRIEIDRVVISSKAVRVEGNFRDKEALFLQYGAAKLSQA